MAAHGGAEICFASCIDIPFFSPISTSGTHELVEFDDGDVSVAEIDLFTIDPTEVEIDPVTAFITGVSGTYGIPEVDVTSNVSGGSIVGTSYDPSYIDLELDLDKRYSRFAGGLPLGFGVPDFGQGASGSYDIVDVDLEFTVSQHHEFTFTPGNIKISLEFPGPVQFWVYDGAVLIDSGTSSTVTFIAGQRLELVATQDNMSVEPTFTMVNNTFGNDTETTFDTAFATRALEISLDVDGFEILGPVWWVVEWHSDWHSWNAHAECHEWGVIFCDDWHSYNAHLEDHGFWHDHYTDPIVFGGADVHEGPVFQQKFPLSRDVDTSLYDQDRAPWELEGFTGISGAAFTLDPNHLPVAVATGTTDVDEGSLASFDGSGSSDLDDDPLTFTWDYGDGSPGGAGVATDHIYGDDGDYTVTLVANDGHGDGLGFDHAITVNNVAPAVDAGPDATVSEGELYSLDPATFHDPGTLDTHSAVINWGDGTTSAGSVTETPFGPPGSATGLDGTVDGSHVYADNGLYTVKITVTDDDGATGENTFVVTVINADPVVDAGSNRSVLEGDLVELAPATFNDPGTLDVHTATVDWGDGTTPDTGVISESPTGPPGSESGLDGTVSGSHVYADNGFYTVTVKVTDDGGGLHQDTFTVMVANAPPVVDAGSDATVTEGDLFSLAPATFNDPRTLDTHAVVIDWGDGSIDLKTASETPFGPPGSTAGLDGTVGGSHTYADDGVYTVTVEVSDDEGATHFDTLEVTVTNALPSITPSGEPEVIIFSPFDIDSPFSDAGFDCAACGTLEDFTATIDWGDETPVEPAAISEIPGSPGTATTGTVSGSHEYDWIGTYTVLVTLTDDDGGSASFTHDVEVLGGRSLKIRAIDLLAPFASQSPHVRNAIKALEKPIELKLWDDEMHPDDRFGGQIYSHQVGAAAVLTIAIDKKKNSAALKTAAGNAIASMLLADLLIYEQIRGELEAMVPTNQSRFDKEMATAAGYFAQAQALEDVRPSLSIIRYRKAWEHLQRALKWAA
jgi:PKD repeat protein